MNRIYTGDAASVLATLPDASVNCCVTSPPYFGLRSYKAGPSEIGREDTPAQYIENLARVFDEVARVLRRDGSLWINIGDSYANDGKWGGRTSGKHAKSLQKNDDAGIGREKRITGLPPKSLIGIPWRLAFALQDRGWILRAEIIWAKANAMPESVRDRPTRSHETVFLFSRFPKYYYDADAIAEPCVGSERPQRVRALQLAKEHGLTDEDIAALRAVGLGDVGKNAATQTGTNKNAPEIIARAEKAREVLGGYAREFLARGNHNGSRFDTGKTAQSKEDLSPVGIGDRAENETRNARDVWQIPTEESGVKEHFAVMPTALATRCLLAGCPAGGTVIDPFFGAGTTGLAARREGRKCIGVELNPAYAEVARQRLCADAPLFANWEVIGSADL